MEFSFNPLSGITSGKKSITDSNGNVLLKRKGVSWDEDDQLGFDMLMKSMDYDYQAQLMNYMNEYNSPAQQSARLRTAGLNPDLQQISNQPSASSNATAPSTQLREGDKINRSIGYAQQFLQLIPQAIDMYTSMKSSLNQITIQDLQIDKQIAGLAFDDLLSDYNTDDFVNGSLSKTIEKERSIGRSAVTNRRMFFDSLPKRQSKRAYMSYKRELDSLVMGNIEKLRSGVYGRGFDASSARSQYLGLLGQHGFNMKDDDFVKILRDFNQIVFDADKQESQNRKTRSTNNPALRLLERAEEHLNKDEKFVGYIDYILAFLIMSNLSVSRTSGSKGLSTTIGF